MDVNKHNKQLFEEIFLNDDFNYHRSHDQKISKMMSLINKCPKRVLDIGCGDGWFGELIKKKYGCEVHGVDLAKKALRAAKKRGLKTKIFNLDENDWPYKSNYFDLVIAGDIIEHVYDTENFVNECKRILKKKGELIISTPNINSYYNRILVLFGKMPLWVEFAPTITPYKILLPSGHVRVFNKDSLKRLVESAGLRVEEVAGASFNSSKKLTPKKYWRFLKIIDKVEKFFSRFPSLATLTIIKAVK